MALYADYSVLYVDDKTCDFIEETLNVDLQLIANWFSQNILVINLENAKTECVLQVTSQKTSKNKSMQVKINRTKITQSEAYEYRGV